MTAKLQSGLAIFVKKRFREQTGMPVCSKWL